MNVSIFYLLLEQAYDRYIADLPVFEGSVTSDFW